MKYAFEQHNFHSPLRSRYTEKFPYLKYYIIVIPQSYQTFLSRIMKRLITSYKNYVKHCTLFTDDSFVFDSLFFFLSFSREKLFSYFLSLFKCARISINNFSTKVFFPLPCSIKSFFTRDTTELFLVTLFLFFFIFFLCYVAFLCFNVFCVSVFFSTSNKSVFVN